MPMGLTGCTGLTGCMGLMWPMGRMELTGRTGLTGLMGRTDTARIVFAASGMLSSATKRNKHMKILLDRTENRCMI